MTSTAVDADVVIVGAGPVGLVVGILLAQREHSVVIVEQWRTPYPLPRAVHFDHEVGRILQSCGIGEELRRITEPAEVYEWRNGEGVTLLRFGRIGTALSGWPFSSMFCQPELESLVADRAAALPSLEIRRGVKVSGLLEHDDHVAVICSDGVIRGRYVVGCDGANSTVRDLLGVTIDDRGFHHDWLIVDVVLDQPQAFDPINQQICDPRRPTTAVSGGPGRRRWEFMRLPDESLVDLADEATAWALLEPWDVHPGNARMERHAVYTFEARVADTWQVGRAFLAGDAAHLMPPFAGQGMCSGLRDAANLTWKLDLVLGGHADEAVLATYDEERRPSAVSAVDFSIELGKVICVPDPDEAAARDTAMSAAVTGEVSDAGSLPGITSGVLASGTPKAGELFPQADLGSRLFDDVHGAGFRLVSTTDDPTTLDAGLVSWFATIGGAVVRVDAPELAMWCTAHGVTWALQRPDFHLYGSATDTPGADDLLRGLRAALTPQGTP